MKDLCYVYTTVILSTFLIKSIRAAFKICLGTQQLLKLSPRKTCIFCNVHQQIIVEANFFNNIHVNFSINYCKK